MSRSAARAATALIVDAGLALSWVGSHTAVGDVEVGHGESAAVAVHDTMASPRHQDGPTTIAMRQL